MKFIVYILSILLSLGICACSAIDDSMIEEPSESYSEQDTISFKINLDSSIATRISDEPEPQVLSDYMKYNKSQKEWQNLSIKLDRVLNNDGMLKAIIYDTEHDKTISLLPQLPQFRIITDFWKWPDECRTFKFSIPKSFDKTKLKINIGIIQQKYSSNVNGIVCSSTLNQFENITMSAAHEFKDSINKRFGHTGIFNINNSGNNYKDALYISWPSVSYYKSQDLFDANNNLNESINIKTLSSGIIVLTDEFNEYDPYFESKLTSNGIMMNQQDFNFWYLTTLDWKANRRIVDYMGSFNIEREEDVSPTLKENPVEFHSYDVSIINEYSKKQYNIIDHSQRNNSWFGSGILGNEIEITNIDLPLYFNTSWYWIKHVPSGRIFKPLASRMITMPYGRPKTLETRILNAETHFDGDETNKEIKYLVCNVFTIADIIENQTTNPYANKWYRFVYEIPEEGLKPGYLYIIRNKPGTKLFKEWDEDNATTRAGETDYIVDQSCLDIEEIQL